MGPARGAGARDEEEDEGCGRASPSSRARAATRTTCTRSSRASAASSSARTRAGNLDPSDIGVANAKFLKNAALIDRWNKTGLIRSSVDSSISQDLFLKGKTAFWFTGPWNLDTLKKSGLSYRCRAFPTIVQGCKAVPFLGVQGFMVTKFAATHGVESLAKDLVSNYMMQTRPRSSSWRSRTAATRRTSIAGKQVKDPQLKAFGAASSGGVPMPNIPQMNIRLGRSRRSVGALDQGQRARFRRAARSSALRGASRRRSAERR